MGASVWQGAGTPLPANSYIVLDKVTASAGQTVIPILLFSYTLGGNSIRVFLNGLLMELGTDYTETSTTSITFTYPLQAGHEVIMIGNNLVATSDAALRGDLAGYNGSTLMGFMQDGTGAVTRLLQSKVRETVSVKDFGAVGDGVTNDTAAIQAAIAFLKLRAAQGGTILFPAGVYKLTTGLTLTNTHGMRFLGEAPAYTAGFEGSVTRLDFYGAGNAITLTGLIATQSAFTLENIKLENKGFPDTNNGIVAVAAGFSGGLQVINSSIVDFSSGVYTITGSAFSYQHFENSAFYYNATWGIAAAGDNLEFDGLAISNNGPDWLTGDNTFSASPVGGGVFIEGISTNVSFCGGTHIEGHRVGIFVRNAFGVSVEETYFEAVSKCAILAINVVGLAIGKNYYNSATEARTILLDGCTAVSVKNNGYAPNVYVIGLTEYELSGCDVKFIGTALDRNTLNRQYAMRDRYSTQNIDIDDVNANYIATPAGGALTNITGPTLQSEIGPFGAPINRYVAAAGGYFFTASVTAVTGQYLYFSVLLNNGAALGNNYTVVVRDTNETNAIVVKSMTSYNNEWSVLTVGGYVPANANYRLTLVFDSGETFDLGGIVSYLKATPTYKQPFSFATFRRSINRRAVVTYSTSMTPNASLGNVQQITATNGAAFTINAATNGADGQRLRVRIRNTSGGAAGVATWDAVYKLGASWTQPANNFSRTIDFDFDGVNWVEAGRSAVDVNN